MRQYDPKKVEKKWQKEWVKNGIYKTGEDQSRPKYYVLDMFPYPSGVGLHVGHPKGYIATDVIARMKMMQGFNVLHPMGWDAFGLPAENYAIKNKVHPKDAVVKNIKNFKKQLELLGFTYDWDREVDTTDPTYYKWTQWAFLEMFKKGLVHESYEPINWCPECKTGLANEDLEGGLCERCGSQVERKPIRQWVIEITKYAERLLKDLDKLPEWEDSIKEMQKNWIGKSEGALVKFKLKGEGVTENLEVFTTRPDTLFGATYVVVAPEHPLLHSLEGVIKNLVEVKEYVLLSKNKSDLERTDLAKDKTGIKLEGVMAINPVNNEELPVYVADYVLMGYGTGAIMAVPGHDDRDNEFARKFGLPIKQVVAPVFKTMIGPDALQPDKPTVDRKTITVFVKHHKEDKYLCLDWVPYGWKSGIIGGVEDGEDVIEAAKREIQEETGYKNLKFIKYIGGEMHNNFFARHKDINRYARATGLLMELIDEEKEEVDPKELVNHHPVWIAGKEMKNFLNLPNFIYMWEKVEGKSECFVGEGVAINSEFLNDFSTAEAKEKIISWLENKGLGEKKVQYKIRDWVFSRQRYWGEPIPLVKCAKDGWVPVLEKDLPLELPNVKQYEPTGTGESPLANIEKWVNTICPQCGGPGKRETNTMPQWAGSCWYYLRFEDPHNNKDLVDKTKEKYWSPIDLYVGGAEHATRHLIYARFWHKFLFDIGVVNYDEPFTKLQHVGLILAEDGRKMSKRWNNVINPDDIVKE
ncbi:MAG: leucine--tRNA ligase, partial [Candidatus Magasanikbacteria bacterium]|nr:leucine--tRNA ligase [Candidatus Magasanikbacteria bacterium]